MGSKIAKDIDGSKKFDWLNPLNMIQLQDAVREHKSQCTFTLKGDIEHTFDITYLENDRIYIRKADKSLAPQGTFRKSDILNWLDHA